MSACLPRLEWLTYAWIMKKLLMILLITAVPVHAAIYRWVDENGNIVYSDEPHPQSEQIELNGTSTYQPVEIPQSALPDDEVSEETDAESPNDAAPVPDYQVEVVQPQNDQGLRANDGMVTVNLRVQPSLSNERGDLLQLLLDGEAVAAPGRQLSYQLENVDRGTHHLQAVITDRDGNALSRSERSVFHLQRFSVNQPGAGPNMMPGNPAPNAGQGR